MSEEKTEVVENEGVIDYRATLATAMKALNNQLSASTSSVPTTLRDLEITKQRSSMMLDAVGKVIQLAHLQELVGNDSQRFKREAEMKVLKPLLSALQSAALVAEKTLNSLVKRMEKELENGDDLDLETFAQLQDAHSMALDNLAKTVATTQKTIKLERESGGREFEKMNKALPMTYLAGLDRPSTNPGNPIGEVHGKGEPVTVVDNDGNELDEDGNIKRKLRKLSPATFKSLVAQGIAEVPVKGSEAESIAGVHVEDTAEEINTIGFEPETPVLAPLPPPPSITDFPSPPPPPSMTAAPALNALSLDFGKPIPPEHDAYALPGEPVAFGWQQISEEPSTLQKTDWTLIEKPLPTYAYEEILREEEQEQANPDMVNLDE